MTHSPSFGAFAIKRTMNRPAPSLQDYQNFHGMLCHPSTARRCIDSFQGGSILFMPTLLGKDPNSTGTCESLSRYDCSGGVLNVWTYYALVLVSFTGLLTLLGRTMIRDAKREGGSPISFVKTNNSTTTPSSSASVLTSDFDDTLRVHPSVFDYICRQQGYETDDNVEFRLARRFDFSFGRLLSVVMFHIESNRDDKLHLVEVYRVQNPLLRSLYRRLFDAMGWVLQRLSRQQRYNTKAL